MVSSQFLEEAGYLKPGKAVEALYTSIVGNLFDVLTFF